MRTIRECWGWEHTRIVLIRKCCTGSMALRTIPCVRACRETSFRLSSSCWVPNSFFICSVGYLCVWFCPSVLQLYYIQWLKQTSQFRRKICSFLFYGVSFIVYVCVCMYFIHIQRQSRSYFIHSFKFSSSSNGSLYVPWESFPHLPFHFQGFGYNEQSTNCRNK